MRRRNIAGIVRLLSLLAVALPLSAHAALERVGPVNPATGYPDWYQDRTGLMLDFCGPASDLAEYAGGWCLLLPGDVTGGYAYETAEHRFTLRKGPVFTHLLLADEINRATPKTQSALLEAMQEGQVTLEGDTLALPEPFVVVAAPACSAACRSGWISAVIPRWRSGSPSFRMGCLNSFGTGCPMVV